MYRRDLLKTTGATAAALNAPAFIGPFSSSDVFTPLTSEFGAFFGRNLANDVPTFGSNADPAWVVSYDPEKADGVKKFAEGRDDAELMADPETMNSFVFRASKGAIGLSRTDRFLKNTLADVNGVERIDLVLSMGLPTPVQQISESDYDRPGGLIRRYSYSLDGVAFDAETTTIGTARETLAVDETSITTAGTETVNVGVIDTGCNVANGEVFGHGQRDSPIRIPAAANFTDGGPVEADVSYGRVTVAHETLDDFRDGTHDGTLPQGTSFDGYVILDLATYSWTVSTQTEFQNGTLTSVAATNSDTLELASSTETVYVSSGEYLSTWHDFGASTTFSTNTTTQTANGGTITYEYRSSSDGTDGAASSWYTDLTNVPENQFLQVRITVEPSSDDQTPTVDSFDIDGEFIVDTQTEWDAGSYTDTTATSDGVLELTTTDQTVYDTSGTYVSEYHELADVAQFTSATTTETLNGQTVTYEYRSSEDGTDATASAWASDTTTLPDAQYVQVRITLETTDDSTTPVVSDYTTNAEQQAGTYVSETFVMDGADRSYVDLSLTDAEATVTVEAQDADGNWYDATSTTITTSGTTELTIDEPDDVGEFRNRIRLEPTIDNTDNATAELQEEGLESPEQILNSESDWSPVADGDGHGTWCCSAIAADPTDSTYRGIAADAPVNLYVAKALNDDGSGSTQSIIQAIDWCSQQGVDVINLSLGSQFYNESIDDALQSFLENGGSAAVVAAGNDRQISRFIASPGDSTNVITVTATTNEPPEDAQIGHFPNVGPDDGIRDLSGGETAGRMPDVGAPGISLETQLPSALSGTTTRALTGTSMSSPVTAGMVTLLLAKEPSLKGDHEAVKERVKATAAPVLKAGVTEIGAGMPQADALLANDESASDQADELTSGAQARDAGNRALSGSFIRKWLL